MNPKKEKVKLGMGRLEYIAYKTMRFFLIVLSVMLVSVYITLFLYLIGGLK